MELKKYLQAKKFIVEEALKKSMVDESMPKTLREAMGYSLMAGGKRIRPILALAGANAVGGDDENVMPVAIALEMIHTFSLIHDDLPAMDDDSLRRGMPTNHKVYGEANAILAGDGLLAEAFYTMSFSKSEPKLLVEVMRDIAKATGARGMTGGQVVDMESTGKKITKDELTNLHKLKTGALLCVSVTSGARVSGASSEQIDALSRYGYDIGLAFQIADDILDIEGDQSLLGKDIGSDVENEKNTYPSIIGLPASKELAKTLVDHALTELSTFGERAEPLRLIAKYIVERDR